VSAIKNMPVNQAILIFAAAIAALAAEPKQYKTGKLERIQIESTQGRTPRNFAIDPTGRHLLAADQDSDRIVAFNRDPRTGKLSAAGKTVEVPSPVCLLFNAAP